MDWYPWYINDFRRDTLHLSLAEDGAYRRLIDEYMSLRAPLPDDDRTLARIVGADLSEWLSVSEKVRSFFRVREGKLHHKRCDQELRAQDIKTKRFSERGKKAAFAKTLKNSTIATRRSPIPTTLHKKEKITTTESVSAREGLSGGDQASPPRITSGGVVGRDLAEIVKAKGWA